MLCLIKLVIGLLCLNLTRALSQKHEIEHALVLYDPELIPLNETAPSLPPDVAKFINFLSSKFETAYADYNDEEVSLFYQGSLRFDHLVLFPSSKKAIKNKSNLNQRQLLKFSNEGGNIFVVGGSNNALVDGIRSFLNEVGIHPAPKNYHYIDHFNSKDGIVELTEEENLVEGNRILTSLQTSEFSGGSAALVSNSELIQPIVKCSKTGYTNRVDEVISGETTWTFGEQGFLAVALQALNNARLVWIGSTDLLADDSLYKWAFQESGVIKLQFVQYVKASEPYIPEPQLWKIKDQAIYTIGVSEYVNGEWVPYKVKQDDEQLQLSFKMLDPYQRLNLKPLGPVSSTENGTTLDTYAYFANFTIPDHHGMFTFELDYKRKGLSYILDKKVVTVRHLANDEFKRSWDITNSWLYIASTVFVIVAWYFFVMTYIYVGKSNTAKKNV
ncbi:uncharacterized protein LODBEIA_P03260 [Lodderomyces beijingensis]|uniref:Dolichyl-diphosphooligosaccharide--protein glycosyltransferase subunit WBP1 n=1 Tax=Lodderomyces beijingensis TaxID=1775926 RepID=A0ABP0ZD48_9ASCO